MKIEDDINYIEGFSVGLSIVKVIDQTTYVTLDGAIIAKAAMIKEFEALFGFNEDNFDRHYSYNLGMLHAFKQAKDEQA